MAKKPTAKAISQFQALAQQNTPPMQKPMMPMAMPMKKKPATRKASPPGMVKGAMPGMGKKPF